MADESWSWCRPGVGDSRPGTAQRGAGWLRHARRWGLAWTWLAGAAIVDPPPVRSPTYS